MRLINTTSLEMREFFDPPEYAILSHRWSDEEVSYEDFTLIHDETQALMQDLLKPRVDQILRRSGYRKLLDFFALCQRRGHDWAWADTCCIDKR